MGVDLCRFQRTVSKELTYFIYGHVLHQQMRCDTVAQGMQSHFLFDFSFFAKGIEPQLQCLGLQPIPVFTDQQCVSQPVPSVQPFSTDIDVLC